MRLQLEQYENQGGNARAASSSETFTPPDRVKTAAKSLPKPPKSSSEPPKRSSERPSEAPELSDAAKAARLRRLCERKPSGKIQVPQEIHDRWKQGTSEERDQLLEMFEKCNWEKDRVC